MIYTGYPFINCENYFRRSKGSFWCQSIIHLLVYRTGNSTTSAPNASNRVYCNMKGKLCPGLWFRWLLKYPSGFKDYFRTDLDTQATPYTMPLIDLWIPCSWSPGFSNFNCPGSRTYHLTEVAVSAGPASDAGNIPDMVRCFQWCSLRCKEGS